MTYERSEWGNNASPSRPNKSPRYAKNSPIIQILSLNRTSCAFPTKIFRAAHLQGARRPNPAKPQSPANHRSRKDNTWGPGFCLRPRAREASNLLDSECRDVALRRYYLVVEVLSEHRSHQEGGGAQCFFADIAEARLCLGIVNNGSALWRLAGDITATTAPALRRALRPCALAGYS